MNTNNLDLTFVATGTAERTAQNNNLIVLDAIAGGRVLASNINITAPPLLPATGEIVLVSSPSTGSFSGFDGHLAVNLGDSMAPAWEFIAPTLLLAPIPAEPGGFYVPNATLDGWDVFQVTLGTSPLSMKGDLFTHDGTADAALPVGVDGGFLLANSATSTGLDWGLPSIEFSGDTGGPTALSSISVVGGVGITTSLTGSTLTIISTASAPLFSGDTGGPTALGAISIVGAGGISTDLVGSTLTITGTGGGGGGITANRETLTSTKTLVAGDPNHQLLDGGAADRDVILPDPPTNLESYRIANTGTTNTLLVKETAAGPTIYVIPVGGYAEFVRINPSWEIFN